LHAANYTKNQEFILLGSIITRNSSADIPVVLIRNKSPESLRIVFSGAENRIEELEACSTCTTFISSPSFCPGAGPVGRCTLKPGQYFVVVESTSDKSITPWSGDWVLDGGVEYTNCFFIIKTYKFGG